MATGNESYEKGKALAKSLGDAVNSMDTRDFILGFVEELSRTHRTLQQAATGVMVGWFIHLASLREKGYFDGRNEASVKLAERIISGAAFEDTYKGRASDTYLPFI